MVTYILIAGIVVVAAIFFYRKKREKEMPAGLQIFDENGDIVFDINDYAFEVYGVVTTTAKVAGEVRDNRIKKSTCLLMILSVKHPNFDYEHMTADRYYYEQLYSCLPNFTIADGAISWDNTYKTSGSGVTASGYNVTFAYGGPSI